MSIIGNAISAGGASKPFDGALLRVITNIKEEGTASISQGSYSFLGIIKHYGGLNSYCVYYFLIPQKVFSTSAYAVSVETESYKGRGSVVISEAKDYVLTIIMSEK